MGFTASSTRHRRRTGWGVQGVVVAILMVSRSASCPRRSLWKQCIRHAQFSENDHQQRVDQKNNDRGLPKPAPEVEGTQKVGKRDGWHERNRVAIRGFGRSGLAAAVLDRAGAPRSEILPDEALLMVVIPGLK